MKSDSIFLPFNVPSLKNGKLPGKNFRPPGIRKYLQKLGIKNFSSTKKEVENYKKRPNIFYKRLYNLNIPDTYPIIFKMHFIRDSKRRFDFINAVQIIADLLTAHQFIPDDNMNYFIPIPWNIEGEWYSIDKINPGVIIWAHN